ncbi:MAG: T9SS type A sorting domain-containing protein, partial [Bacteroidales bacterium]|nr:T9SS type A sorting domain-containing protein [Bacteroidales bacterium]
SGSTIAWSLGSGQHVRILIYDLQGRMVASPVDEMFPSGNHTFEWKPEGIGSSLPEPGVYFLRLSTPSAQKVIRLIRE